MFELPLAIISASWAIFSIGRAPAGQPIGKDTPDQKGTAPKEEVDVHAAVKISLDPPGIDT